MRGTAPFGDWTLTFDFNALCIAEKEVGPIGEAMGLIERGSLTTTRALIWAGLQATDPCDLAEAGNRIGTVGADKAGEAIGEAMSQAFGTAETEPKKAKAVKKAA